MRVVVCLAVEEEAVVSDPLVSFMAFLYLSSFLNEFASIPLPSYTRAFTPSRYKFRDEPLFERLSF